MADQQPQQAGNWVCHACGHRNFQPLRNDGDPTCPHCLDGFVEEMDSQEAADQWEEEEADPLGGFGLGGPGGAGAPIGGGGGGILGLLGALMGQAANRQPGQGPGQGQGQGQRGAGAGADDEDDADPEWVDEDEAAGGAGGERQGQGNAGGAGGPRMFTRTFQTPGGGGATFAFGMGGGGRAGPAGGAGARGAGGAAGPGVLNLGDFLQQAFGGPPNPNDLAGDDDGGGGAAGAGGRRGGRQEGMLDLGTLLTQLLGGGLGAGGGGDGRFGDYVFSQEGLDNIITQLMEAGGGHAGPVPASEEVIERLEKFKITPQLLESEKIKDCAVCKDDFEGGDDVVRLPCQHIYHADCIVPWLKQSGTCAVCRYELVPQHTEGEGAPAPNNPPTADNRNPSPSRSTNPQNPPRTPAAQPSPLADAIGALFNANASAQAARSNSPSASRSNTFTRSASASGSGHRHRSRSRSRSRDRSGSTPRIPGGLDAMDEDDNQGGWRPASGSGSRGAGTSSSFGAGPTFETSGTTGRREPIVRRSGLAAGTTVRSDSGAEVSEGGGRRRRGSRSRSRGSRSRSRSRDRMVVEDVD